MRALLINDSSSNPNWGDRAAAIALKRMMRYLGCTINGILTEDDLRESRFFASQSGEGEESAFSRSIADWMELFLPPATLKLAARLRRKLHGNRREASGPIPLTLDAFEQKVEQIRRDHQKYSALVDSIERSDIVVIHGDGCMVGNGILPRSELFLGYLVKTHFRKPVIMINHTADFSHPELNRMAAVVYPMLDDVTYRDRISEEVCRGRWPGRYAADTAFQFVPAERDAWRMIADRPNYFDVWPDEAEFDPKRPYICIGGSSIYSFDRPPIEISRDFIALVRHLRKVYEGQIVLTASDSKDQVIFRPVARTLGLPLIGLKIPVQQAVDIIGNAQAYIGGRWHPAIFALRGGTPVIPLSSKTFKMQALVEMAGLPLAPYDALDLKEVKEKIGRMLDTFIVQGEKMRCALRVWSAQQAENSWDNLAFLKAWDTTVSSRANQMTG